MLQNQIGVKYFLYCRKSSEAEDRQVASIESQVEEMKKLAGEQKLQIADIITEAKSAKSPGRHGFGDMVARINKGEANGIICWKLDRLARNPIDGGSISWLLQQGAVQHIFTYGRSYYPTDNVLMMAVELGMANQYVRDLSVNVKRGVRAKLDKGEPFGPVPEGYLNTPDREKGNRIAEIDPVRFPLVRKMWDLMLTGHYYPQQILKIANNEWNYKTRQRKKLGNKPFSRAAIYRTFTNPFYYGMIRYQKTGELFQGKHEPMVTKEEFDKVQALLRRKGLKPAPHTKEFAHTGQIACSECGCSITAEDKTQVRCNRCKVKFAYPYYKACPACKIKVEKLKDKTHLFYTYYHCTKRRNTDEKRCLQPSVKGDDLEGQILEFFQTIAIQQKYVDWALEYLRAHPATGKLKTKEAAIEHNRQQLENVNKSLSKLTDMRLGDLIGDEEFKAKKQTLEEEKSKCEAFLARTEKRAAEANSKAEGLLTFAERAMREYKKRRQAQATTAYF